ncbi:hypothetical protein RISK_006218 [Rhodopirellula islandica]|uniref:Uncharacterized protein n=1 Tax=Rhodopirellula islandica TaxID=595434 RepID=A0A0J1E8D7_RHOIS|nr:hypothetical protein RISK_006218 [Rhodopirellula islandica]
MRRGLPDGTVEDNGSTLERCISTRSRFVDLAPTEDAASELQSVSGSASHAISPISHCQFAMSSLQFAIVPPHIAITPHRPGRGRRP